MRYTLMALVVLAGCGSPEVFVGAEGDGTVTADAPLLGANGDAAERGCNIVLRTAQRTPLNGGYATSCGPTGCFTIWSGFIDISAAAAAEGAKPQMLYKSSMSQTWTQVAATPSTGAPAGWVRYAYRIDRDTIPDGISFTSLARARVELSPFLATTSGARLFDHNRRPGDFETYVLSSATGWELVDDANVCQPRAQHLPTLSFENGWATEQHGALVAGREAVISYAVERLRECRATHNGYPAWGTKAFVRFSPSGVTIEGPVVGFESNNGSTAGAPPKSVPFSFMIPAGTTSLETWFLNSSGAGNFCESWDSNLGNNYRFNVEQRGFAAVKWVGNAGSSFSRACTRANGVPSPEALDSYILTRACSFIEVDVYVPGLTDGATNKPEAIFAQAVTTLDGRSLPTTWLHFVGRYGNDYRFHFEVPRSELYYGPKWELFTYALRFSTDGNTWVDDGSRSITRDPSFVNPSWP